MRPSRLDLKSGEAVHVTFCDPLASHGQTTGSAAWSGGCRDGQGTNMMSAEAMRPRLPVPTPRIRGEMLAFTKSQVDPSEAELIQRVLRGQDEAFRELVRPYEHAVFMATQSYPEE